MAKNPFLWWLPDADAAKAAEKPKVARPQEARDKSAAQPAAEKPAKKTRAEPGPQARASAPKPKPAKPKPAKPKPAKAKTAEAKTAKPVNAGRPKPAKPGRPAVKAAAGKPAKSRLAPVAPSAEPAVVLEAAGVEGLPGHLIRRAQQIAVAIFLEECNGMTPVQHAALSAVVANPGADATRIAGLIALDRTTISGVLERLEGRGLIGRAANEADRRAKTLEPTASGKALVKKLGPAVLSAQERMLAPLSKSERSQLMTLLGKLVELNNDASRAPSRTPG